MAGTLDRAQVAEIIRGELAEILEKSPSDIVDSTPFTDLGADSLALIELVEAIEEKLSAIVGDFHIDDEDLQGLLCVNDAVEYVVAKLA
jgi:acyl carrier protein